MNLIKLTLFIIIYIYIYYYFITGTYNDFRIAIPEINASYPYISVGIPGKVHNWSFVPTNAYGLYCTFAELQALVENNDSWCPKSIEITIGHNIPLAKYPSTANSTQLSFNNTIYSLVACEEKGYIGVSSYVQETEVQEFIRTFDGVSATNAQNRAELPKRDMWFRIPYHSLPTTLVNAVTNQEYSKPLTTGSLVSALVDNDNRLEASQTIHQLIDSYIPELLQNNDEVYTLYPGENQYQKTITGFDPTYCAIDATGPGFNEALWQLDTRFAQLNNREITGRNASNILALPVAFQLKGNNDDFVPDILYDVPNTGAQAAQQISKFADLYYGRRGTQDYTTNLPKIFIKGVPIVDSTNNLVPHTFCCTVTWTMHVECTPRSDCTINRLQWRMTWPILKQNISATGVITSQLTHEGNFSKKPYRSNYFKRMPFMRLMNLTDEEKTSNWTRGNLKNVHKNTVRGIALSANDRPDDITPSDFSYSLPFHAGWFEGHTTYRLNPVPAAFDVEVHKDDIRPSTSGSVQPAANLTKTISKKRTNVVAKDSPKQKPKQ